jgi:hypothetical protein
MSVSSKSAGAKLLWLTVLAATGLVATATAATVFAASDLQRLHARDRSSATMRLEGSRNLQPLRALADSVVAPLGTVEPVDSLVLTQMVEFATSPADADRVRVMTTYRGWARLQPLPAFWNSRVGFSDAPDPRTIVALYGKPLQRLAFANEAAADSALLAGHADIALLRARENIAVAQHLVWQPHFWDAALGRQMMLAGAKLLARASLQAQQHTLHESAQRLVALTTALQPIPEELKAPRRAYPSDSTLLQLARDRSLHPATRFLAIELMVASACRSPRDVLFGPSTERHTAVDAMIDAARDIPRLGELRPVFHRTLDRLEHNPEELTAGLGLPASAGESSTNALLRVLVPDIVEARIDACRASGA